MAVYQLEDKYVIVWTLGQCNMHMTTYIATLFFNIQQLRQKRSNNLYRQ